MIAHRLMAGVDRAVNLLAFTLCVLAAAAVLLGIAGCTPFEVRTDGTPPPAVGGLVAGLEAAGEAVGGQAGNVLTLGGYTLALLFGVRSQRAKTETEQQARLVQEAQKSAQESQRNGALDRKALTIAMGGLEMSTEARAAVRNHARAEGVSDHMERLIAGGWVRDVRAPPEAS